LEGAEQVEAGGIDAFEVGQVEGEGACGLAAEAAEWALWNNKLAGAGVTVGPA